VYREAGVEMPAPYFATSDASSQEQPSPELAMR
jgi:hypothetical protein